MDKRLLGHTTYRTEYHITWNTKYRRRSLNPAMRRYLSRLFPKLVDTMPGCEVIESKILADHVHLVMVIPPNYTISKVVGTLKGRTSSALKERYELEKAVWSPGYFVGTVGVSEKKILSYVRNQ